MTRGRVAVLLAVALGVWALAFLRGRPQPAQPGAPAAEASQPLTKPGELRHEPSAKKPEAPASKPANVVPRKEQDEYRRKLMEESMRARHENDERFERVSGLWEHQGRVEPWASQREQRLRAALQVDRLDHLLLAAECRADLCRLEISAPDSDTAMAFRSSVAFVNEVGPNTAGGMTGSGPDRALVIFVPRESKP
jgi:hypothetical protein